MHFRDAPAYTNALRTEELLLRGSHISSCKELADLPDRYDVLDLTHNDLDRLTGEFAELRRLSGLLLAHNKISLVAEDFGLRVPRLEMLSLAHNEVSDVAQLQFLRHLPRLQHLSLEGNPITENLVDYRDRVVALQPKLRFLDYERVREADRQRAVQKFGGPSTAGAEEPAELRQKRDALLAQLEKATDLAEIDAIDKQLAAFTDSAA